MGPEQAACAPFEKGLRADRIEAVFRETFKAKGALLVGALRVERLIELLGRSAAGKLQELVVGSTTAEGARAVASGKSRCFIEEEKFCPVAGLHQFSAEAFVLELTDDPGFVPPVGGDQFLPVVVEDAPVAGEKTSRG